jgi:hypothetical protein
MSVKHKTKQQVALETAGDLWRAVKRKALSVEEEWAKSGYAAVAMAAQAAESYVVVYDRRAGEVQILDGRGGLLCYGPTGGELDCTVDFNPADLLRRRVKRYVNATHDGVEAVAL